ncbi:lytic transglycosylase domain-containing protein [Brevundimonas bacteroides]|uniref:lytic transglycosylase domain-containing protein n=1 Tax=Brevundimonas bacteroides TaxID=74311 RepID=UPI00068D3E8C|nr:lytic transglycosylase domain-containing protein [Brevundimonas bacteroides]
MVIAVPTPVVRLGLAVALATTAVLSLSPVPAAASALQDPTTDPGWASAGGALFVSTTGAHAEPGEPSADLEAVGADPARALASSPSVGPESEPGGPAARVAVPDQPFMALIGEAAARHGLDPKLLHAVVTVESAYRPGVCSPAGACGLTQLMPGTAAELGVSDRFDPGQNLAGGADYLARQILRFGDLQLALAAYNSGPARVARLGRVPDIAETRAYVRAVIACYLALGAGRPVRSARDCPAGDGA